MHTEFNVLKKMYFEIIIIIMNSLAENVLVTTS